MNPAKLSPETADGSLYAVPPRNHQRTDPGGAPAIRPRHVLLRSRRAIGGFRDFFRSCARHRPRRQIRGGKFGLPSAAIALFPGERRKAGVCHLPRSASDSARRGGGPALFRCLPAMPRVGASSGCRVHGGRLHHLSHAEAARGRRSARDHDRPSDSAACARQRACRIRGTPGGGVSRRGGALLSVAAAGYSAERSVPRRGAGGAGEQRGGRAAGAGAADRAKSSRESPSSTWCWATAGRARESRARPLPRTSGRWRSSPIRRGRCARWRQSTSRTPNRFSPVPCRSRPTIRNRGFDTAC